MSMPSSLLMSADVASSEMGRLRKNIEDKIADHNRAITDMKIYLNTLTAIARLPPEVLSEVFLHYVAISGRCNIYGLSPRPYSWVRVTHVCHHWREVALHTPRLWSDITVVGLDLMEEVIARSRQTPLSVSISCAPGRINSIERVLQESHRIRSIEWTNRVGDARLPSFTSEPGFPRLEKLAIMGEFTSPWSSPMFRSTLKHLVMSRPPQSTFPPTPSSVTLNDVVRALESMPLLEHLDLQRVLPATVPPSATYQAERAVNLPHLAFLRIADVAPPCLRLFDILSFSVSAVITLDLYTDVDVSEVGRSITKKLAGAEASESRQPLRSLAILPETTPYNGIKIIGWTDVLSVADLSVKSPFPPSISISLPTSMDSLALSAKLPVAHVRVLHVGDIPEPCLPTGDTQWTHPFRAFTQVEALQLTAIDPGIMIFAFDDSPFENKSLRPRADPPLLFPQLRTLTLESVHFRRMVLPDDGFFSPDFEADDDYASYAPSLYVALSGRVRKNAVPMTLILRTCINVEQDEVEAFKDVVAELFWDNIESWDEPEDMDDERDDSNDADDLEYEVQPEDLELEDFW